MQDGPVLLAFELSQPVHFPSHEALTLHLGLSEQLCLIDLAEVVLEFRVLLLSFHIGVAPDGCYLLQLLGLFLLTIFQALDVRFGLLLLNFIHLSSSVDIISQRVKSKLLVNCRLVLMDFRWISEQLLGIGQSLHLKVEFVLSGRHHFGLVSFNLL